MFEMTASVLVKMMMVLVPSHSFSFPPCLPELSQFEIESDGI